MRPVRNDPEATEPRRVGGEVEGVGGVADELVEAADMGSGDGLGADPDPTFDVPLTEDDGERLGAIATKIDGLPEVVMYELDGDLLRRDVAYLRGLSKRIFEARVDRAEGEGRR